MSMNVVLLLIGFYPVWCKPIPEVCLTGPGITTENPILCRNWDFDGDGDIDLFDFAMLQRLRGSDYCDGVFDDEDVSGGSDGECVSVVGDG